MAEPIKLALAQLNYVLNDFEHNVDSIRRCIAEAHDVDLLVFSELALSGYCPQDLLLEPEFLPRQDAALNEVLRASTEGAAHIVVGLVRPNPGPGKPRYNSLAVVHRGRIVLTYDKQLLPSYDVFNERRYFEPGPLQSKTLRLHGNRVGFVICEDGWGAQSRDYVTNPLLALSGELAVDLVVSINASPSDVGKREQRHAVFSRASANYGFPIVYVNQVGGYDQLVFDGGSFVASAGEIVHEAPLFQEALERLTYADGMFQRANGEPCRAPRSAQTDSEFYFHQIVLGLRDYCAKLGFRQVVVGSSGGIDSALTLVLACEALGPENVTAITMPSRYSSTGSVDDSQALCRNLGVRLLCHPIGELYEHYVRDFGAAFDAEPSRLTRENVQARIRGAVLMEYSNHFGHLVLSTGNKSEVSVGYATLYGDMCGGLNLIGDLYKTEVYALSRWLNAREGGPRIPQAILDKEPSAELSPDQRDTDSLPPYAVLDEILKLRIEGTRLRPDELAHARQQVAHQDALDGGATHRRVLTLIERSEFKRQQAAPIIRVRGRAFGIGRQVPLTARGLG